MSEFEELEELLESLGIDQSKVYRILLSDGTDVISEVLPFNNKSTKITAVNPLKILKEHFVDEGLLMGSEILTLFDYGMENPVIELNRNLIITMYKVDHDNLERYVYTLFDYYFPLDIQIEEEISKNNKSPRKQIKTNIISFVEYRNKRQKGTF